MKILRRLVVTPNYIKWKLLGATIIRVRIERGAMRVYFLGLRIYKEFINPVDQNLKQINQDSVDQNLKQINQDSLLLIQRMDAMKLIQQNRGVSYLRGLEDKE